mmetsp:Transcript_8758/g.13089  ORF Transcript_8758/g.13089 Transcript_8758/m.13089 type:complete len:139 (-) Transcript_8758:73-489(-)
MEDAKLRKFDTSTNVVRSTVEQGVYGSVVSNANPDWGLLLSHTSLAFKQLEFMWSDMDPLFQLMDVLPRMPTEHPSEVPYLLSTRINPEDSEADITVDSSVQATRADIEDAINHNRDMDRLINMYTTKATAVSKGRRK